ncbi:uncharacterized protein M437DRAFT_36680 [Aureobasidium melanogenum CBS 110374]|uniref:Uncharacterized protein n=1 Tax=Aureobasidium melanogenum (strain CBS 110374) TaxID=1043003 RepID=A0A074W4B9_AURM1|nr:uncharacterized protein M437DRAFT_36680 [Aureobasidium melanogenum CBS 110374]KEQ67990.1 hypothetical protein M437DRAFT_36680 [Aureobasidium melanogenum CBS 110374]
MNVQQLSPSQQVFDASFWNNSAPATQYYGHAQVVPQSPSFNNTSYMPNHQNMQSFPPTSLGNPSYQTTFDPAAQMLQNWRMVQSGHNPYSQQHYSMPQTPFQQTTFEQPAVQQAHAQPQTVVKQDLEAAGAYSSNYVDFDMEDDPSAQLMAELASDIPEAARSPTLPEASDIKYQNENQGWGNSVVNHTDLGLHNSMFSNAQALQNAGLESFQRFESQNPVTEAEKTQEDQLTQQIEQVVAGLIDEGMQDVVSEEQTTIRQAPDYTSTTASTPDHGTIADAQKDVMQDNLAQEHTAVGHEDQDELSEHDTEEGDMDEEESIADENAEDEKEVNADETVEDEDADVDVSDAEPSSDLEAHDSGAEVSQQVEFEGYTLTESTQKTIKKTIAKKEDKELHHRAFKLQPHHIPEHRYWVAILMHTMQPSKAKVEKDFVWLKGHKTNTVETMWNKYREVTTEEQHQILFCGRVPQFTDTLEELDRFGDKLIVFRAAKQEVIVID